MLKDTHTAGQCHLSLLHHIHVRHVECYIQTIFLYHITNSKILRAYAVSSSGGSDHVVNLWRIASCSSSPWLGSEDNSNDPPDVKVSHGDQLGSAKARTVRQLQNGSGLFCRAVSRRISIVAVACYIVKLGLTLLSLREALGLSFPLSYYHFTFLVSLWMRYMDCEAGWGCSCGM